MIAVDERNGRPAIDFPTQAVDQIQVFLLILVRFGFGDGGFAQQVYGEGQRALSQPRDRG